MEKFGYMRVACAIPVIQTADCGANIEAIIQLCEEAFEKQVGIVVFPELCVTGYTCSDLFYQKTLLNAATSGIEAVREWSEKKQMFIVIGAPLSVEGGIYNCAIAICDGEVLGIVPKTYVPNSQEFYEKRWFHSAEKLRVDEVVCCGKAIPIGTDLLFKHKERKDVILGIEICEDLFAPIPPSSYQAIAGATIILNPSASNEIIGKSAYRQSLVMQQSARCNAGYLYCSCGFGESTTDMVFGGDALICEKGVLLEKSKRFETKNQLIVADVDVESLIHDRQMQTSFGDSINVCDDRIYTYCDFSTIDAPDCKRDVNPHPFIPVDIKDRNERCEEIFNIQTMALGSRVAHVKDTAMVVGISGGLDSTLALLVCVNVCDRFEIDRKKIRAITMPGFGTTDRTYDNAVNLIHALGVSFHEISIKEACTSHFEDIGHAINVHDVTYENAQARERTQILMDLANQWNGLVIGTGDLSELALGWATYNGDHMSMYGVNGGIPKTLVRYLVRYIADCKHNEAIKTILYDVLDTPVSPELLPPDKNGKIAQKTENLVGPYELHDFFIYHVLRNGYTPGKIYALGVKAFMGIYDEKIIYKWLRNFYWRFFNQQFKRSCLPDGPKVGSVSLSPRGDWRMPSDAKVSLWMKELDAIKVN
ncbi:MAG: NAD(+) synthase [Eubacterium sp.]